MAVGDAHRAGLGVLVRVRERRLRVLVTALAEGLDPAADAVAVGLDDGDGVSGGAEQMGGGEPGRVAPMISTFLGLLRLRGRPLDSRMSR